jgi:uncharacterized OB-fold protein
VELAEGPRLLANVVTRDPAAVVIGTAVKATFVAITDLADGAPSQAILRFTPA